jgi:hypothetical protein
MCAGFTPNDKIPKAEIAHGGHTRENKEKKRRRQGGGDATLTR